MPDNKTIQDALDYLIDTIITTNFNAASGVSQPIKAFYSEPPTRLEVFPAAVAWVKSGEWMIPSAGWKKGRQTLSLQIVLGNIGEIALHVAQLMNYSDAIPNEILDNPTFGGNIDGFAGPPHITYSFGEISWGDQVLLGWDFSIFVNMQSTVT